MIVSDLDGTVRQPLEPFASLRDESRLPAVRVLAGLVATLLARRINHSIEADLYLTGSPRCEDATTRLWLLAHGMRPNVLSNPKRSRFRQMGDCGLALPFKEKMLSLLAPDEYYDDDPAAVEAWRRMR